MPKQTPRPARHHYTTGNAAVDAKIGEMVSLFGDHFDRTLLAELMTSAYRLGDDRASTGDLKLLNAALKELRYAFKIFRPYRHVRKVATFGSARVSDQHPAYGMAKDFGRLMAKAGWMVITGAASGIMRAGHEGAGQRASFGLNIRLPFEQEANAVIARDDKLINCKYFFTRKLLFVKESHATVLFPGGFGTLDEGFESLTLVQTGKSDPRPTIFVDTPRKRFWAPLLRFIGGQLVREGMISANDRSIYQVAHSAQEAADMILQFYAVYHSLRHVGDRLVLRLQERLPERIVTALSKQFHDLLISGDIIQTDALPEEADEPELQHLSRLVLHFNRWSYGRLIELIHRLNECGTSSAPQVGPGDHGTLQPKNP